MAKSPAVILFDSNGLPMAVEGGVAIPVGTQALLAAGSDGTNAKIILTDASGRPVVVGAGTAGTPSGGVVSIQGVGSGTPIPISGTVTTSSASTSANNAAAPTSSTQVGGTDGTNLQAARVFDVDSGAGTQYVLGATLRKSASGGSVEAGTSSDPLRIDPTGTTTQPVSVSSLPLPSGAATETTLSTKLADSTFTARINTLGQKVSTASTPVVLASDQSTIPVSAASLPLPSGAATETTLSALNTKINSQGQKAMAASTPVVIASDQSAIPVSGSVTATNASIGANNSAVPSSSTQVGGSDGTNLQAARVFDADSGAGTQFVLGAVLRKSASGGSVEAGTSSDPLRIDPTGTTTQPISASSLPLPTGAATETTLSTRLADSTFTGRINTQGQKTMSASTPVVIASDQSAVPVSGTVTSNIGTTNGLALDTTLTGGTAKSINRGGAKGATTAADVTSTAEGTDHQALDVQIYHGGAAVNPTAIRALTSADVVTAAQGTAAALSGAWPVKITDGTNTMPTADTAARSSFHRITDGTNTAAVKAASTAAVAADPAVVVAVSPNNTVAVSAASLPLPSGAATETTLSALNTKINTQGQKTMAASTPVVLASDQSAIPVSGTVTATSASTGSNNATAPTSSTQIGGSDGTNLQAARIFDADSGAGTQYVLGAILRKSASGGSVEAGTSSDPFRVDPTGTTTQPISAASLPLPTGAATETTLGTRLADATFTARINTLGQKVMAASTPVVIASDQTAVPVSGTVTSNIGTTNGLALDATLTGNNQRTRLTDGTNLAAVKAASTAAVATDPALVVAVSPNNTVPVSAASLPLPTGAATETTLASRLADATFTGRINTLGQKTMANSTPVVLASDQSAVTVTGTVATTPSVVGAHANAWNAVTTGTNGNSSVVDCQFVANLTVFGNSNGSTTISIQASQNNTNFYTVEQLTIGAGGGDFGGNFIIGARYVRLQSSTNRTVTASIVGKA